MSIIDAHTHAFPDDLAARAIARLEEDCPWKAVADGRVASLIESMDACEVDVSVVATIATKPDQVKGIFRWCGKIHSDRIEPLPSVHPDTPKAAKWVEKIAKAGFAGIKLHPMYQGFAADDPRLDELYAAAAECGLMVQSHCGRDIGFPANDDRASPRRFRRVIERFPKLRLLCTHMGGWQAWDEVEKHLIGTGVYMETSFSLGPRGCQAERIASMIRRHGAGRVMLGSDWPWNTQAEEIDNVRKLPLGKGEIQGILCSNAARLLGY
ncbi:MAG TPA: amidohydrolase family protein [Phycisphaerae bacterium]|nr:amidohydrolase family protein [Phycisphaerae bacterium]